MCIRDRACTGVHGANRLASNSLMECLVFAHRLAEIDLGPAIKPSNPAPPQAYGQELEGAITSAGLMEQIEQLRLFCWQRAGVDRSGRRLNAGLDHLRCELERLDQQPLLNCLQRDALLLDDSSRRDLNLLLDLRHRLVTSRLMLEACLFRQESRGGHFRTDAPSSQPQWQCHSRQSRARGLHTRAVRP